MATKIETTKGEPKAPVPAEGDWFGGSLLDLRREMDRLFENFARGWHLPTFGAPAGIASTGDGAISVRFDVSDGDDAIEVSAELPGIDEKDVEVTLDDGVLTIKGEKKAESEEKKKDYVLTERHYGAFRRSFRLPDTVEEGKIKAKFEKGVLRVTLPKTGKAKKKAKKIAISKG